MRVTTTWIVSSCLISSLAYAQPGEEEGTGAPVAPPPPPEAAMVAPPPPMQPMPEQPPAPVSTVDRGVIEDANAGRSWVMPTALTEPAGTWSFSDYELFLVSLGYSVTDQLSLSATTLLPAFENMPFVLLLNAKYQVLKSGRVRGALQGALTTVREDGDGATAGVVGGALTLCLDDDCHSHLSGYVGAGIAHEDQSAVPLLIAGSLAYRLGTHIKLLLEADSAYIAGGDINQGADGFLGWYGVRFTSSIIGVDLGFAKPICTGDSDCSIDELPMGIPFVSFTYRSLKTP
ncbi:MAG: hypothetical protein JWP01_4246 [Myxococcales bacterium]|nr:hypothetical protein [Myxococcales bacterium]